MISIFEFSYRYIIPSIKRRLVEKLVEIGVTRKEIAKKLDLSTSAISRYLSMERGTYINIAVYNDVDNAVNKLASLIKNNIIDFNDIQVHISKIVLYALSKKYVCKDHAKVDPKINPNLCLICPTLFSNVKVTET